MFRRFIVAILSITISGLKLICNMLSLFITMITKTEMPLFGINDEHEESIKRSHYVVENDSEQDTEWYENPIKY